MIEKTGMSNEWEKEILSENFYYLLFSVSAAW